MKIFSCILCEACSGICPTGIDIPQIIYHARKNLRDFYFKASLLNRFTGFFLQRIELSFKLLKGLYWSVYPLLYSTHILSYLPKPAAKPLRKSAQVYKSTKKIARVAIFVGCNVNYLYQRIGYSLLKILIKNGFEVVILKGEVCCGAPLKAMGFDKEALLLAKKNIELFNRLNAEAIISLCPTCTLTIRNHYPVYAGDSINNLMDTNEFLFSYNFLHDLSVRHRNVTYHDPCHLKYGLGIKNEPREILKAIQGIELIEMMNTEGCCGFGGLFSIQFKGLSRNIGRKKMEDISQTDADTLVTSCPGCILQLEGLLKNSSKRIKILHIAELVDEASG
jgi:glycolate oxidase iron-sulfur subunit